MKPRERVLRVLLRILNNPDRFTTRDLAKHFSCSTDTIKEDYRAINNLPGVCVCHRTPSNTYRIEIENKFDALQKFYPLSEEDKGLIIRALHQGMGSTNKANMLQTKIEGLYDFQQLGLRQLRHPAIVRINQLEEAKQSEVKVKLIRYRSNSNKIKDRIVEPFVINPELDTLQAFDYERGDTRHFRLSRIERVQKLDEPWENKHRHESKSTDVFRIRNTNQHKVLLRLSVYAYNVLIETYPMSASYIDPDPEKADYYFFQGQVNSDFKGILNFIMGYASEIEIVSPQELKDLVKATAENIFSKY